MIKKIEAWLRRLIAEEVATLEGRLTSERAAVVSYISVHTKAATNSLTADVLGKLNEFEERVKSFETQLGQTIIEKNQLINELNAKVEALQNTAAKFSHWKADSEVVNADHSLKLVK